MTVNFAFFGQSRERAISTQSRLRRFSRMSNGLRVALLKEEIVRHQNSPIEDQNVVSDAFDRFEARSGRPCPRRAAPNEVERELGGSHIERFFRREDFS